MAAVLKVIAGRGGDSVARYGGEEFAVIVPASPLSGVLALAERLREAVEGLPLPEGRVSISIGVGYLHPPALASAGQLLADADAGLYAAKRAGRNRVVLHAQVLDDEDSAHGTIDC